MQIMGVAGPVALEGVVLIDGTCVLCSSAFRFVAKRDPACRFRFCTIQGHPGRDIAIGLGIDPDAPDSFAVVLGGRALLKSDGALAILRDLRGWRWTGALRLVPRRVRDWAYDRIAKNRYAVFGRLDACVIPSPALAKHMLVVRPDPTYPNQYPLINQSARQGRRLGCV